MRLPQEVLLGHEFSFSRSAAKLGARLETRILELTPRLPNKGELYAYEERAQKALGLKKEQPFYIIARLRLIDGVPRAIHRASSLPHSERPANTTSRAGPCWTRTPLPASNSNRGTRPCGPASPWSAILAF